MRGAGQGESDGGDLEGGTCLQRQERVAAEVGVARLASRQGAQRCLLWPLLFFRPRCRTWQLCKLGAVARALCALRMG